MYRRFIFNDFDDSDDEDEESLHEILVVFGLNKAMKSIKYKHQRLNWDEHIRRLQHTKTFRSRYHMTHTKCTRIFANVDRKPGISGQQTNNFEVISFIP